MTRTPLIAITLAAALAQAGEPGKCAAIPGIAQWWTFDNVDGELVLDAVSARRARKPGGPNLVDGVVGKAGHFCAQHGAFALETGGFGVGRGPGDDHTGPVGGVGHEGLAGEGGRGEEGEDGREEAGHGGLYGCNRECGCGE